MRHKSRASVKKKMRHFVKKRISTIITNKLVKIKKIKGYMLYFVRVFRLFAVSEKKKKEMQIIKYAALLAKAKRWKPGIEGMMNREHK